MSGDGRRAVRARHFLLAFLVIVVAVPIAVGGLVAIERAERTAVAEVRSGNQRAAVAVAGRIEEYVGSERLLVETIGETVLQMREPGAGEAILDAFLVKHQHVRRVAIFERSGSRVAGDENLVLEPGVDARRATIERSAGALRLGHAVLWQRPVTVAGSRLGTIVAEVDLVGLWEPVNAIQIGDTGFASLVLVGDAGYRLLAHGKPEKRGRVFSSAEFPPSMVEAARRGDLYDGSAGSLIVTAAQVRSIDSVLIIEQSTEEALAAVSRMKTWLFAFFAGTLVLALVFGVFFGRQVVRPLEKLRRHIAELGKGKLEKRVDVASSTRLLEAHELASSINEMAAHLDDLQREKIGQERLNTFARVAAGLAHDIRHPIESVRTACYDLLEHPDDPRAIALLRDIGEFELPRLKKFVDDLHGLARTGTLETERFEHDALELAEAAVDEIAVAPKWGGAVKFTTAGESASISVDGSLVRRALYNLMSNGAEACMDDGQRAEVSVTVSTTADGESVVYDVRDNGPGIEKSRLADLLSSDFRSTKRSTGVGLGLGVVRQVAESHGGRLAIESEPGVGSTFSIYLPRAAYEPAGDIESAARTKRGTDEQQTRKKAV